MSDQSSHVVDILDRLKALPLTGKVISVLPTIPCVVGLTDEGKAKIAHIPQKTSLKAIVSGITASGWDHTIVAWTGEILSTKSDAFQQLLKRNEKRLTPQALSQQLDDITLDDPAMPDYLDEFAKPSPKLDYDILIDKQIHGELAAILKDEFPEEIIPVWFGTFRDDKVTMLLAARDTARIQGTTSAMLYQTLHDGSRTVAEESFSETNYEKYEHLSQYVAQAIVQNYQPGDIIWIHTQQHMLLPNILRKRLPSALIVYAQNELWASKQTIPKLYKHRTLMTSLLSADTIAVPTEAVLKDVVDYYDEQKEFTLDRAKKLYPDHHCDIFHAPIGLNLYELKEAIRHKDVLLQVQALRNIYIGKKTIIARARVDQLRGMLVVLGAFRHLLRTSLEWTNKVFLFILITPNRLPGYTFFGGEVTVNDIFKQILDTNSRYGSASYVPVIYLGGNGGYRPRTEYLALLRVADVGIAVNNQASANDMSREFVVAQETNCSPLLVATWSREATEEANSPKEPGRILYGEVIVDDVANADAYLRDALSMSETERIARERVLFEHFTERTALQVTTEVITDMGEKLLRQGTVQGARPLPMETMLSAYESAEKSLLILDYDGTLTPIVNNPDDAVPTQSLLEDLKDLAELDGNLVYIVSGRSREFLRKHFGSIKALGLSAEHGCYFKRAGDPEDQWVDHAGNEDLSWKEEVESIFTGLESVYPGSWIERKEVAMVWHYRNAANQNDCFAKAVEIKSLLETEEFEKLDLVIMLGKANLEARPRSLSKGSVVRQLITAAFGGKADKGFIFCAGDDTTDEDMFRTILTCFSVPRYCFTCLVGDENRPTIAQYRVDGPENVVKALLDLANTKVAVHEM